MVLGFSAFYNFGNGGAASGWIGRSMMSWSVAAPDGRIVAGLPGDGVECACWAL